MSFVRVKGLAVSGTLAKRGVGVLLSAILLALPAGLATGPPPLPGVAAPPWVAWIVEPAATAGQGGAGFALDAAGHPRVLASVGGVLHYDWSDGVQWHDQLVGIGEYANTDHSLAFDRNGLLHAVISTNPYTANGGSLVYGTMQLSGAWSFERILSGSPNVPIGMRNRLLFDPSGSPHILYQEWSSHARVKHAYKDMNGWHVEGIDSDAAGNESATLDAQGRLHICYDINDGSGAREAYATRSPSTGWSRSVIDGAGGGACGLAFDPQGALHVAYVGAGGAARFAVHDALGWSYGEIPTGPVAGTDLAIDATGRPHVALWEKGAGLSYATVDAKGAWTTQIVDANDSGASPRILVDAAHARPEILYLHHPAPLDTALARPDSIAVAMPVLAKVAGAAGL